jgi:hypothetical protein
VYEESERQQMKPIISATPAFLTGSRAYGMPTDASDIDIVILIEKQALCKIFELGPVTEEDMHYDSAETGVTLRYENLNLIFVASLGQYDAWKKGTLELVKISPVSRDYAVKHFEQYWTIFNPKRNS